MGTQQIFDKTVVFEAADIDYEKARILYGEGKYQEAFALLRQALFKSDTMHPNRLKYESFYGLTMVHLSYVEPGMERCRLAAKLEPGDEEIMYNLAQAEHLAGNRPQALLALRQLHALNPQHHEAKLLRHRMGRRRQPVVKFLPRQHKINVVLGKLSHRLAQRRRMS